LCYPDKQTRDEAHPTDLEDGHRSKKRPQGVAVLQDGGRGRTFAIGTGESRAETVATLLMRSMHIDGHPVEKKIQNAHSLSQNGSGNTQELMNFFVDVLK
jgi:hypothetical protein